MFDSASSNTLLTSNVGKEVFLVSSSDQVIGRSIFSSGAYDFDKFERSLSLLDKTFQKTLLVDIGANIGTICIPAIKRNIFERAIAIEPEPYNFSLLQSNIIINGLTNRIAAHNSALGSKDGEEIAFELSENNYGDHRIRVSSSIGLLNEAKRNVIRVKSERFDELVGEVDPSDTLIWIDTQGFEGFVLAGANRAIQRKPPLVIEFWPYGMNRSGAYGPLKQAIIGAGYRVFYDLSLDGPPTQMSGEALDGLFRRLGDDGAFTDLLIF